MGHHNIQWVVTKWSTNRCLLGGSYWVDDTLEPFCKTRICLICIVSKKYSQHQFINCLVTRAIWNYTNHLHWPLSYKLVWVHNNVSRDEGCHGNLKLFLGELIGYHVY